MHAGPWWHAFLLGVREVVGAAEPARPQSRLRPRRRSRCSESQSSACTPTSVSSLALIGNRSLSSLPPLVVALPLDPVVACFAPRALHCRSRTSDRFNRGINKQDAGTNLSNFPRGRADGRT